MFHVLKDVKGLGHEINGNLKKSISVYCERIVRNLSRTSQDKVSVSRHDHYYELDIHRDSGGNIQSIDVLRARHNHDGMHLTCTIKREDGTWIAKSSAVDPLKYTRLHKRIKRIAHALERDS